MAKKESDKQAVVVTTAHRGIFVGYTNDKPDAETITLEKARMIVFFSADTRGVLGLATRGPQHGSRVTPAVERITLREITAVMKASPQAVEAWESEPWS